MISCSTIQDNISAFLDDELASPEREQFAEHLVNCKFCTQELKAIEKAMRSLHSLDLVDPPKDFHEELMGQLFKIQNTRVTKTASKWLPRSWFPLGAVAAGLILMVVSWSAFINGELPGIMPLTKNQPLELAMPKMASAPEEKTKQIALFNETDDMSGSAEVGSIEEIAVNEITGGTSPADGMIDKSADGALPLPEGSPHSYNQEFRGNENENIANNGKAGKMGVAPEVQDIADESLNYDEETSRDSRMMAMMGAPPDGQTKENEGYNDLLVAASGVFEETKEETEILLEVAKEELPQIINKIEKIVKERELEIEFVSTEKETKIDIQVPVYKQKEIEEIKLLVQEKMESIKQIEQIGESDSKTGITVLITIRLSEY